MGKGADVNVTYRKFVALALFVLALSGAVLAQDFSPKVRAYIPFNFYAGGKLLPAGNYTLAVNRVNRNVAIVQKESGTGTFLLASQLDDSYNGLSLLIFRSDGEGAYVLEKMDGTDLSLSFATDKVVSHVALAAPEHSTHVIVAGR